MLVAGVLGPTNRTCSISPDVNDPGARNITFKQLVETYTDATRSLLEGGADLILVETIFDTLNAKAALFAIDEVARETEIQIRIMISGTITDASGRTLSGQTTEAFWFSVRHQAVDYRFELRPWAQRTPSVPGRSIACRRHVCFGTSNAGLPNQFGEYDLSAAEMAEIVAEYAKAGLVNIIGGCCGTTPEHPIDRNNVTT